MRIGIVGLGYVGLTLAFAAADKGIEVFGTEVNRKIKDSLKENRAHFHETGLNALIEKHNNKNFYCVESFPEEKNFDAFVITVGTPLRQNSKTPNFDAITSAIKSIGAVYDGSQLVILRSTVSVGTTRKIVLPLLSEMCGEPEEKIFVAMCPERTLEGKAIRELTSLPQIVSGNNPKALAAARKIFSEITPAAVEAKSLEEAELAKLYCNTYRDMNFAIGNAFCLAAQSFGVDGVSVIHLANDGYGRANIALPGFVAGPCLEKDSYLLTNNMPECESKDFILTARRISESLEDSSVDWVTAHVPQGGGSRDNIVVLSGMAFKGQPETSDLRGSSSVNIARKLKDLGYNLRLHDFTAYPEEMRKLNLGEVFENLSDACRGAAALLVLTNHKKYFELSLPELPQEKNSFPVLDIWQVCEKLKDDERVKLFTAGNFLISEEAAI